jgi:LPXTG-motif cell wall-anchored protein
MPPIRRRLRAAAFILSALAAAGAPALAQNETANTIGPPQLKDFSLPGQRTTPPATTPPAPAATPPVAAPRVPPTTAPAPSPERPAAQPRPEPRAERPGPAPDALDPAPAAADPEPRATEPSPVQAAPEPLPGPDPEAAAPAAPAPAPAPAQEGTGNWLWPAAGGALILLAAAVFLLRRRRARSERESARELARGEIGGALFPGVRPEPEPEPVPEPEPAAQGPAAPRPWLELDIVPERAAATEHEVHVRYALTMTNRGDADARNIRIDPRLFNAGAEGEMMDFFQGPIHDESGSPHIAIPPGATIKLTGQVAMPNAELREIELAGRRVFVPMVAINVAYDWADGGRGRTSRSWLVGREAQTPQEKMGPFRLDLGPRIYRSVGRREARLVMV